MSKKLYMSLIFSNLVVIKTLSSNHRMYNLYGHENETYNSVIGV